MGRRERVLLVDGPHLALVDLPPDFRPFLLVHLVRVVRFQAGLDPFLLGQPGELVLVKARGCPAVLTAVTMETLFLSHALTLLRPVSHRTTRLGGFLNTRPRAPWSPAAGSRRSPGSLA